MVTAAGSAWPSAVTDLAVPAHPDFVASVRALVRANAVLADLAVEDVEELQIAVGEAATLLLPLVDGSPALLAARLRVEHGSLQVGLRVRTSGGGVIDRGSLAWMMLSTLDPDVHVGEGPETTIEISRARSGGGV